MNDASNRFMCGVVEGFYGRPWNARQRHQLFGWMRDWKLNTYLYAPKDDLKHRLRWRELYLDMEAAEIGALIRDCQRHGIEFIYGISPGLDFRYSSEDDLKQLKGKLGQLLELGAKHFALLLDDIPEQMNGEDERRFVTLGRAQASIANEVLKFLQQQINESCLLFCPTHYCGRAAQKDLSYLRELGEFLDEPIDLLWTGPEVISERIPVESIRELQSLLQRRPILWDNLFANDYDLQQVFLGPYSGRLPELKAEIDGILCNPNCQFEANMVPLRTLSLYAAATSDWQPRLAYAQAQKEWRKLFVADGQPLLSAEDLELLGDLFYLPHELGTRAREYLDDFQCLLRVSPKQWGSTLDRFIQTSGAICDLSSKLAALQNRDLHFSLQPFVAEVNQAARLLLAYVSWLQSEPKPGEQTSTPLHAQISMRGRFVANLQNILLIDEHRRTELLGLRDQ